MSGGERSELAETLDLLDAQRLDPEQVQHRIEQHRAVAGREHEPVAIGPGRIRRVEFQESGEQHGRHIGGAHRQSGVAGLGGFDRIHREGANGIRHAIMLGARNHGRPVEPETRKILPLPFSPRQTQGS